MADPGDDQLLQEAVSQCVPQKDRADRPGDRFRADVRDGSAGRSCI